MNACCNRPQKGDRQLPALYPSDYDLNSASRSGKRGWVPISPGRTDASQKQTDENSFAVLEATADGLAQLRPKRTNWLQVDVQNATDDS